MVNLTATINANVDAENVDAKTKEVVNPRPSKDMIEALKEAEEIIKNPDKYPGYTNIEDLKKALLSDD